MRYQAFCSKIKNNKFLPFVIIVESNSYKSIHDILNIEFSDLQNAWIIFYDTKTNLVIGLLKIIKTNNYYYDRSRFAETELIENFKKDIGITLDDIIISFENN